MRTIKIADTTLRDAHQCLWATRMTTAMMLPVAERMDQIGFEWIDSVGPVTADVCVRYLKEDPFERIRQLRRRIVHTPLESGIRSKSLTTFDVLPDDVTLLWLERVIASGVRHVSFLEALFEVDNVIAPALLARELGAETAASLVFCESPVHTDALYAAKAREFVERAGVSAVRIKDSGGLLTPDRVRTLVPAMRAAVGESVPIHLHSHCTTGLAPLVYLEGAKAGVDLIECAIAPLANGTSQPATQTTVRNLREIGFATSVDDSLTEEVGEHFRKIAYHNNLPLGVPVEYDAFFYRHQVPGGMQTNLRFQLEQAGLIDRHDEVLKEIARIREELGWPIMVTPFSQLVGTQAVFNVIDGERYKTVPDEVKKYALGYYGRLLAPVAPDVLDRIVSNGSRRIALAPKAPDPMVGTLRKKYPKASDEERLLRYLFTDARVEEMLSSGPMATVFTIEKPLVLLLKELTNRPRVSHVFLQKGDVRIRLTRQ
jgi:oxaloacetate decarboxylase (Na+ extruding) subunit alpha